jgi:hypothetical protein
MGRIPSVGEHNEAILRWLDQPAEHEDRQTGA